MLTREGEEEQNSANEYEGFHKVKLMEERKCTNNLSHLNIDVLDQNKRKCHVLLMSTDYLVI